MPASLISLVHGPVTSAASSPPGSPSPRGPQRIEEVEALRHRAGPPERSCQRHGEDGQLRRGCARGAASAETGAASAAVKRPPRAQQGGSATHQSAACVPGANARRVRSHPGRLAGVIAMRVWRPCHPSGTCRLFDVDSGAGAQDSSVASWPWLADRLLSFWTRIWWCCPARAILPCRMPAERRPKGSLSGGARRLSPPRTAARYRRGDPPELAAVRRAELSSSWRGQVAKSSPLACAAQRLEARLDLGVGAFSPVRIRNVRASVCWTIRRSLPPPPAGRKSSSLTMLKRRLRMGSLTSPRRMARPGR